MSSGYISYNFDEFEDFIPKSPVQKPPVSESTQKAKVAAESLSLNPVVMHVGLEHEYSLRQTEGQRLESAKRLFIQKDFDIKTIDLSTLNLSSESRFSLAIDYIQKKGVSDVRYLPLFQLEDPHHLAIVKKFLPIEPWDMVSYLEVNLPLLPLEGRRELISFAARQKFFIIPMFSEASLCHAAFIGTQGKSSQEIEGLHLLWKLHTPEEIGNALTQFVETAREGGEGVPEDTIQVALGAVDYWRITLTSDQFAWVSQQKFFEKIFCLEAPFLRIPLIYSVAAAAKDIGSFPNNILDIVPKGDLLKLPLSQLLLEDTKLRLPLITAIQSVGRELKDTKRFTSLWMTLNLLVENTDLNPSEKTQVIEKMCHDPKQFMKQSNYLCLILQFNRSDLLQQKVGSDFASIAEKAFESVIGFSKPETMDHCLAIFSAYRQPDAMMRYAANLHTLKDPEIMASLASHMSSVFDKTYERDRYDVTKNAHLQKIAQECPGIFMAWKQNNDNVSLQELLAPNDPSLDMRTWLQTLILETDPLETVGYSCPELQEYLMGNDAALDRLKDSLKQEKNKQAFSHLSLQNKFCQLAKSTTLDNSMRLLQELLKNDVIPRESPLRSAMEKKYEEIQSSLILQEFSICETDSAEDIFLSGNEVVGSCQNVSGDPNVNKGLLGYLHHGQTRLIAVKDREGRIVARSLIRLLWDGKKPVLFLEKLYTAGKNIPLFESAIFTMAKRCADRLSCPLTSMGREGPPYLNNLQSLDGVAPHEFVDGCGGLQPKGQFEIALARLIYTPYLNRGLVLNIEEAPEQNPYEVQAPQQAIREVVTESFLDPDGWGDETNPYECGDEIY